MLVANILIDITLITYFLREALKSSVVLLFLLIKKVKFEQSLVRLLTEKLFFDRIS